MTGCKSLLLGCAVFLLVACDDPGTDPTHCNGGKCDDLSSTSMGKLMPRSPVTPGTIAITRNQDTWLFEVIGAKGEIVLLSEDYAERTSALNGVLSVEENGVLVERYVVDEVDGGWSFALRAGNNEVLADSQLFPSEQAAREAVAETRDLIAGIVQYKAALDRGAHFDLSRHDDGWEFELRDEDGLPLLGSQVYARRRDAITGIESVRVNGKQEARYELLDGPPRFILLAANGQEIGESSTTYDTLEEAQAAVASLRALLSSERVANPW